MIELHTSDTPLVLLPGAKFTMVKENPTLAGN